MKHSAFPSLAKIFEQLEKTRQEPEFKLSRIFLATIYKLRFAIHIVFVIFLFWEFMPSSFQFINQFLPESIGYLTGVILTFFLLISGTKLFYTLCNGIHLQSLPPAKRAEKLQAMLIAKGGFFNTLLDKEIKNPSTWSEWLAYTQQKEPEVYLHLQAILGCCQQMFPTAPQTIPIIQEILAVHLSALADIRQLPKNIRKSQEGRKRRDRHRSGIAQLAADVSGQSLSSLPEARTNELLAMLNQQLATEKAILAELPRL